MADFDHDCEAGVSESGPVTFSMAALLYADLHRFVSASALRSDDEEAIRRVIGIMHGMMSDSERERPPLHGGYR